MNRHRFLLRMMICALFAALLCICSPLAIPIGPVPVTLSVFAVLLCGVVLEWRLGLVSVVVYLLLGLFLPVFSGGMTGLAALPGPTGGYIWSYPLMILTVRLVLACFSGPKQGTHGKKTIIEYAAALLGCLAAMPVCYLCGTVQFSIVTNTTIRHALSVCVLPFLLPDLIKALCAALLGVTLRRALDRVGY